LLIYIALLNYNKISKFFSDPLLFRLFSRRKA
jgi:hypothetical protein